MIRSLLTFCMAGSPLCAVAEPWPNFGRGPERVCRVTAESPDLGAKRWLAHHDTLGQAILFNGQSGVVADGAHAYAIGQSGGVHRVYAFRLGDGEAAWQAPIAAPYVGSWSSPALDVSNACVITAAGSEVRAWAAADGSLRWTASLESPVVNASPVVTGDLGARDRVFVTDYDGFGAEGRLYCINADARDALVNPCDPGDRVWSVVLGGTSGNSPAYRAGVVYVASASDETGFSAGVVRAFSATALSPTELWARYNPAGHGFYGGVCVQEEPGGLFVYAASYSFTGGQDSANLVKLDASDGAVVWSVACTRTDGTPIPLGDGRVIVSGGVPGFGSVPSIQLFEEQGGGAARRWDSALDSWNDLNGNGVMDPGEFLLVGGWTHQPAALVGGQGARLVTGTVPLTGWSGACTDLYVLDLSREPADPGFVLDHAAGSGSTPALTDGVVLTIGQAGLYALGDSCYPDCTGDGVLAVSDFGCFQTRFVTGDPYADCTGDAAMTAADFGCFQTRFVAGCP